MPIAKLQFIVAKLQKIVFLDKILGNTHTKHYKKALHIVLKGLLSLTVNRKQYSELGQWSLHPYFIARPLDSCCSAYP